MTVDGAFVGAILLVLGGLCTYIITRGELRSSEAARDKLAEIAVQQQQTIATLQAVVQDQQEFIRDTHEATAEELFGDKD